MTDASRASSTISVVLCTCNGAQYLPSQLASIASQTRGPNEMVVRDDASSDATVETVEEFAANSDFPVLLTRNRTRLGIRANFEAAIADASCEYLALCDQDDIWDAKKLQVLAGLLDDEPKIAGAVSDAQLIREDGKELQGATMWQRNRFSAPEREAMDRSHEIAPLLRGNVVPGACLMFRASFRGLVLPFSLYSYYDHWMALLLQSVGGMRYVETPLQRYRLHSGNAVGIPSGLRGLRLVRTRNMKSAKRTAYRFTEDVIARLEQHGCDVDGRTRSLLGDWSRYAQFRATLPDRVSSRALPVLEAAIRGSYRRHSRNANRLYSRGTVSWMYDLVFG